MARTNLFDGFADELLEQVMSAFGDELHGKAASVVDPETGKHVPVFVRRVGTDGWAIHSGGSAAFARALEHRLGLNDGEVHTMSEPVKRERLVYLAHASEDKHLAEPLANGLMQRGIKVWYDNWEIGYGDSLRRKMEEGLGSCTHFIVLLTETSIQKSWVNEEIDAGLMGAVEGTAKFIGLRHELPLSKVSPFLKTRLTPEFKAGDEGTDAIAGEIFGLSKKPPLGVEPRYVERHRTGTAWSASARVVAEYFVRSSEHARTMDPQASYAEIQRETGLPMPDVRVGVLDLIGAGLLDKQEYFGGEGHIWPRPDLFVTFDAEFMDWDPERDARDLAVHLINLDADQADASDVGEALGWAPRRFNAAAAYLVTARVVKPIEYMSDDSFWPCGFLMEDELLRFVKSL